MFYALLIAGIAMAVILATCTILYFSKRKKQLPKIGTLFINDGSLYLEVEDKKLGDAIQQNSIFGVKEAIIEIKTISQK